MDSFKRTHEHAFRLLDSQLAAVTYTAVAYQPLATGFPRLLFLRMNQFPQRGDATHEERARIQREEARFGGEHLDNRAPSLLSWSWGTAPTGDFLKELRCMFQLPRRPCT